MAEVQIATPPRQDSIHLPTTTAFTNTATTTSRAKRSYPDLREDHDDDGPSDESEDSPTGSEATSGSSEGYVVASGSSRRAAKRVRSNDGTSNHAHHTRRDEEEQGGSLTLPPMIFGGEGSGRQIMASPTQTIPTLIAPMGSNEAVIGHAHVRGSPLRNVLSVEEVDEQDVGDK